MCKDIYKISYIRNFFYGILEIKQRIGHLELFNTDALHNPWLCAAYNYILTDQAPEL